MRSIENTGRHEPHRPAGVRFGEAPARMGDGWEMDEGRRSGSRLRAQLNVPVAMEVPHAPFRGRRPGDFSCTRVIARGPAVATSPERPPATAPEVLEPGEHSAGCTELGVSAGRARAGDGPGGEPRELAAGRGAGPPLVMKRKERGGCGGGSRRLLQAGRGGQSPPVRSTTSGWSRTVLKIAAVLRVCAASSPRLVVSSPVAWLVRQSATASWSGVRRVQAGDRGGGARRTFAYSASGLPSRGTAAAHGCGDPAPDTRLRRPRARHPLCGDPRPRARPAPT